MKKILFTLTIIFSCIVFTPNVFAYTIDNQYYFQLGNMNGRTLEEDLFFGTSDIMIERNIPNATGVVNNIRNTLVSRTESSDFEDFQENYYYTILYKYDSVSNLLSNQIYYTSKENGTYDYDILTYSNGVINNTSIHKQFNFFPHISQQDIQDSNRFFSVGPNGNILNYVHDLYFDFYNSNSNSVPSWRIYNSEGQDIVWMNMGYYLDTNPIYMFFDSNFNCNFNYNIPQVSTFNSKYFGPTLRIAPNDFDLGDTVFTDTNWFYVTPPNIQNLGNNSFAFNINTITNFVNSSDTTFIPIDITCPRDREFVNNVCTIYNTDFTNYNKNFVNFYQQPFFYVGRNANFELDSSKYYILTIRLFTSYNFQPDAFVYVIGGQDFGVQDIYKVVVNDSTLYKDYQIVFKPSHTGIGYLEYFTIKFNNLSDFTSDLGNDYSFGIFKTFKISQYDTMPTDSEISEDNSVNNLTSISNKNNGSFFSNFKINDRGLSQIVTLPLGFIRSLSSTTCANLVLPLPFLNTNVTIECLSSIFESKVPTIWSIYKLIINGILCYMICLKLFSTIRDIFSPDDSRIEVIDL